MIAWVLSMLSCPESHRESVTALSVRILAAIGLTKDALVLRLQSAKA
jgi:hypothetical protein